MGVTSHLVQRINQPRNKAFPESFSTKYSVTKLLYYQVFREIGDAIRREKQLKVGSRQEKLDAIQSIIPEWKDLYDEIVDRFSDLYFPL